MECFPHEVCCIQSCCKIGSLIQQPSCPGKSCNHQTIPAGQDFIILVQGGSLQAITIQFQQHVFFWRFPIHRVFDEIGNPFPFKITLFGNIVSFTEGRTGFTPQYFQHFLRCEQIKLSFDAFTVSILAAVKRAVLIGQFSQHITDRSFCNVGI